MHDISPDRISTNSAGASRLERELQPIDFAAFARACGAAGYTITAPDEAEAVLHEALARRGPAIIEAVVDPTEPPLQARTRRCR